MNILVTSIGGDIAQSIINILRSHYQGIRIVGCDIQEQPFFANLVDVFDVICDPENPAYISELEVICRKNNIDIIIPVSDSEIKFLSYYPFTLDIPILKVSPEIVEISLDKFKTSKFVSDIGDFSPKTFLNYDPENLTLPIIVKPRFGRGSKDVRLCSNVEEVNFHSHLLESPIFQELLLPNDREITCGVYRNRNHETHVIQLQRRISGGRTNWARVVSIDSISIMCEEIAYRLDLLGSINIQCILTSSGPKVFEINPRYSSSVAMRHKLGFSDLVWGIEELLFGKSNFSFTSPMNTLVGRTDSLIIFEEKNQI